MADNNKNEPSIPLEKPHGPLNSDFPYLITEVEPEQLPADEPDDDDKKRKTPDTTGSESFMS
jgi:hypothetical protein